MKRAAAAILAIALLGAAGKRSWRDGVPVQMPESGVHVVSVSSTWQMDWEYAPPPMHPGPIYFDDCVAYSNDGKAAITHVQFVFVGVDSNGIPRRESLPLDLHAHVEPGARGSGCRDHVYPNGDRGLWLVGYPNVVDYADGTSWKAPPLNAMQPYFAAALTNLAMEGR